MALPNNVCEMETCLVPNVMVSNLVYVNLLNLWAQRVANVKDVEVFWCFLVGIKGFGETPTEASLAGWEPE